MSLYTRNPYFPDGSPRRFAGMHRPPFAGCSVSLLSEIAAGRGASWHGTIPAVTEEEARSAWLAGRADFPLYLDEPGIAP